MKTTICFIGPHNSPQFDKLVESLLDQLKPGDMPYVIRADPDASEASDKWLHKSFNGDNFALLGIATRPPRLFLDELKSYNGTSFLFEQSGP
jgi:hypothetical protein